MFYNIFGINYAFVVSVSIRIGLPICVMSELRLIAIFCSFLLKNLCIKMFGSTFAR